MRPLHVIADEIEQCWEKPYFGAVPYIQALKRLESIHNYYLYDSGDNIVRYLLGNMTTFRGEDARRIKLELKEHLRS